MKRVRVIHNLSEFDRETTKEFALSFARYSVGYDFDYLNINSPINYSDINETETAIVTYELMSLRNGPFWLEIRERLLKLLTKSQQIIVFVQDDYAGSKFTEEFMLKINNPDKILYSPVARDLPIMYPNIFSKCEIKFCLTGYVDEDKVKEVQAYAKPFEEREIFFGNRVRNLPIWLGEQAIKKSTISKKMADSFRSHSLEVDESSDDGKAKIGIDWLKFLGNTKYTAGSMGGSSLTDPELNLSRKCRNAIHKGTLVNASNLHKYLTKENKRGDFSTIGPRLFEAGMTRTCQILIEDNYLEGFEPGTHYISCEKDMSNLESLASKINEAPDVGRQIAERSYKFLIESGLFTYKNLVNEVLPPISSEVARLSPIRTNSKLALSNEKYFKIRNLSLLELISQKPEILRLFRDEALRNQTLLGVLTNYLEINVNSSKMAIDDLV